jgi:hypothetical protein
MFLYPLLSGLTAAAAALVTAWRTVCVLNSMATYMQHQQQQLKPQAHASALSASLGFCTEVQAGSCCHGLLPQTMPAVQEALGRTAAGVVAVEVEV